MSASSLARAAALAVILGWTLSANGQVAQDKPGEPQGKDVKKLTTPPGAPTGHIEVPNDPYLAPDGRRQARSRATQWERNGYISYQVNVDSQGNNIIGDAANEPSIAVDPNTPFRAAIGWRQFDSISSDFRQAGWGYTSDGGRTWTFPGRIEAGVFRSDPVVDSDGQGVFYYNSLTADNGPIPTGFECKVFRSFDGGATWDAGVYAYGGDKQWQVIDTSGGPGDGHIYACWNSFYSACAGHFTRSTDGGDSFEPCTDVPGTPYWGTLAVGPDGALYVSGQGFLVAKSSNAQYAGQPIAWDFSTTVNLGGSIANSAGPNPGGLLGQVWIDVDRSNGPNHGNVYLLCSVDPPGSDPMDVMFARSTDGGQTWSAPVQINDDAGNHWQWFGTMSVAPNGRIDAIWNDTRNDPGGYDSELHYSYSEDGGLTWSPNVAVSPSFDPHLGWPQQNKIGDYYDMASDNLGVSIAYSATFNGEQDVYFLRIGALCADAGEVTLDRGAYGCEATVGIQVSDCGLNTDDEVIETVTVDIDSDTEAGVETVVLTETDVATGWFEGAIAASATDSPGVLHVTEGDTLAVTYIDADDGDGGVNIPVTATAVVDCTAPQISNVQALDIGPFEATVTFESDEPSRGTVHYGATCGSLTDTADGSGYDTSVSVNLRSLDENSVYYYAVEAEDEAGNAVADDNGGVCYSFATVDVPNYFTEQFGGDNDLDNLTITFLPDGSGDYYAACVEPITSLPTDPAGGTVLSLGDDDHATVTLSGGASVSLYGVIYTTLYPGSNGYITFTAGDDDYTETIAEHFELPRISLLFNDFSPQDGGTVSWKQFGDRVAVTYEGVPEYSVGGSNTFQAELFFDGTIVLSYLSLSSGSGITGLSAGAGEPTGFYETDLSDLGACGPKPPNAYNGSAETSQHTPVLIGLDASDDGLPDPPSALDYVITDLPGHGVLHDPGAGAIDVASLPYTLAGGGDTVEYVPAPCYHGSDSFRFVVDDGGVAPDGGTSNEASVSIDVTINPGSAQRVLSFPLDSDPGWTTQGLWAFGQPVGGGTHGGDPLSGYSGTSVLGFNLSGDYPHNMVDPQYLTTTAIDCSNFINTELRFRRWLGVEASPFDNASIELATDGKTWTTVWSNPGTSIAETQWTLQAYDLSAWADGHAHVQLRWSMGPTDYSNSYPGWNIDDVEIWAVPVPPADLNGDNIVDTFDFTILEACLNGPVSPAGPGCECTDLDGDGDTDLDDYRSMQEGFKP